MVAPFIYSGIADSELVVFWVRELLLPSLPDNSVLVWDNAAIHKSTTLKNLIEDAGHTMIFLPPYSPDLNPIEHKWQKLKHNLRSYYDNSLDFLGNLIFQINLMSSID